MILFVSQPFKGRTEEEIFEQRRDMIARFVKMYETFSGEKGEFEVIDQYHQVAPEGASRFYYLGNNIQMMSQADFILFAPDWREAKGCQMEHTLCDIYDLPFIEL